MPGVVAAKDFRVKGFPKRMPFRGWFSSKMKGMTGRTDSHDWFTSLDIGAECLHLGGLGSSPANAQKEKVSLLKGFLQSLHVISSGFIRRHFQEMGFKPKWLELPFKKGRQCFGRLVFPLSQQEEYPWLFLCNGGNR